MIYHNPYPDRDMRYRVSLASRWANHKPDRWWRNASPRARSRQMQIAYNFEHNAAKAFQWMLDQHHWRRHPKPFAKTNAGFKRRQERLFRAQHKDLIDG